MEKRRRELGINRERGSIKRVYQSVLRALVVDLASFYEFGGGVHHIKNLAKIMELFSLLWSSNGALSNHLGIGTFNATICHNQRSGEHLILALIGGGPVLSPLGRSDR